MLSREIIEKTEVFLKRKFDAADYLNAHPEAKAYRIEHTYRVANIGRELALDEKADFPGERTPFALSVGAADNIDRFDVFRIHETLTHDGFFLHGD